MAVTTPTVYKGMYLGNMEPKLADMILQVRDTKVIPNLKNMIFDFPPELVLRSIDEQRSIRSIIKEEGMDYQKYVAELRDYQTVGTAFMYVSPRSIIGDGVGLGKTIEIAALLNFLKQTKQLNRFLMAVETSALGQTQCEIMRFTGLHVVQLPAEAPKLRKAIERIDWNKVDGIIIKHSTLRSDVLSKWLALNIKKDGTCRIFNTFILDESSVIKNTGTKTAIYTKNICDITPRVHFMNATTFETHIMDIYNQTDMMDRSLLPKKWVIEKQFCVFRRDTYWTSRNNKAQINFKRVLDEYKNQEEFKKLLELVYLGRSTAEVGLDKPHIYKVFEVEPTNDQSLALAKGYRYMEVLNCPSLISDINIETNIKNVPKLERLIELVKSDFMEDSILIYCFHKEAQEVISKELRKIGKKPAVLNGDSTDDERLEIQNKFNGGEYDVVVTNVQKSLNLYGGDVCIFYSVITNPSKLTQTAGRIDRNIDDKIKTFVLLLYKGTDEYRFFTDIVKQRARDSRELTIDAKGAVDLFIESMGEDD